MRILYITERLPFGPGEAFILPEMAALARLGHEVLVAPLTPGGAIVHARASLLRARLIDASLSPSAIWRAAREIVDKPRMARELYGVLKRERRVRFVLGNVIAAIRGLAIAEEVRRHQFDHVHCHWAHFSATMALVVARASGVSWSLTAHRYDIAAGNLLAEKVGRAAFTRVIDRQGEQELSSSCGGIGRIVRIHVGVEVPGSMVQGNAGARLLVTANLVEKKGHRVLLEAMAQLRRRGWKGELDIVGDGRLRRRLERLARNLGVGASVRFWGVVGHETILARLQAGEWGLVVLPSIETADGAKEGIPVALIEALAAGVPVISTFSGGIPELLEGGAGVMVQPGDPSALARAIETTLADGAAASALAAAGRARVMAQFDGEVVARRLEREMLGGTARE